MKTRAERSYSYLSPKLGRSWETEPDKLPDSSIAETLEADIAVIGCGLAGLAAGARLSQLGFGVICVDKNISITSGGDHIAALDSSLMQKLGVSVDKERFARDWMSFSGSRIGESLLWLFMNRSGEAFDWFFSLAESCVDVSLHAGFKGADFQAYPCDHHITLKDGCSKYKSPSGVKLACEILQRELLKNGGKIYRGVCAEQLEKDSSGRVTSFIAKGSDGVYRRYSGKKAVILATGGIKNNPELLEAFCPIALKVLTDPHKDEASGGDGHKMAYWAKAALEPSSWAAEFENSAYNRYSLFFLHINRLGRRFMNEDTHAQGKAIRCLMQPGGDYAFTLMDSKWSRELGERFDLIGGRENLPLELTAVGIKWESDCGMSEYIEQSVQNGLGAKADSLEELAAKLDIPYDTLKKTVERYNELCAAGCDADFGKRSELLTSVSEPPFYALKWGPALAEVYGGVLTDSSIRVLNPHGEPIPGLFALGAVSGGVYSLDYPPVLSGSAQGLALTWALILGETILSEQKGEL